MKFIIPTKGSNLTQGSLPPFGFLLTAYAAVLSITSRFAEIIKWNPKGMPLEERRLVQKIGLLVLVYACLAFFTKYLDVSALSKCRLGVPHGLCKLTATRQCVRVRHEGRSSSNWRLVELHQRRL
jgi:hypothetical protein